MTAPRRPPPAYASERASSSRPRPADWCSGSTTSSERPHRPSRSIASAAPASSPLRSLTHAPPGSRSMQLVDADQRGAPAAAAAAAARAGARRARRRCGRRASWTASASSLRIGRGADIRSEPSRGHVPEPVRRLHRQRLGERAALGHDLAAERAAARAFAQVPAQRGAPQRAVAQARELEADLLARRVARLAAGDQRACGPGTRAP